MALDLKGSSLKLSSQKYLWDFPSPIFLKNTLSGELENNFLEINGAFQGENVPYNSHIFIQRPKKILVLFDLFTLLTGKKCVHNNFLTAWKMMRFCSKGGV